MAKVTPPAFQLVSDWKQSWKYFSVQLTTIMIVLQVLEENLPAVQAYLPEGWVKYIGLAILVGRVIQQGNAVVAKDEPVADESKP